MLSISAYETVGNQIALVALGLHLPARVCRDQGPVGWRVDTQLAGASDFRDRQLLHRYRPQLRRPLAFGLTSLADQGRFGVRTSLARLRNHHEQVW